MYLFAGLSSLTIALLVLGDCIEGTAPRNRIVLTKRFKSLTEALNYFYDSVSDYMPLDARCRRYAVMISMFEEGTALYDTTVANLAARHEYLLNQQVQGMDDVRLSSMLIYAIDKYRSTELAPAFIDLLDCLREIETDAVQKYMGDRELIMIETFYRKVRRSPDMKFDLASLEMFKFHPTFMSTLRNLFGDYIKDESSAGATTSQDPKKSKDPSTSNKEGPSAEGDALDDLIVKLEHGKLSRRRERDRLRQRRLRILKPEQIRERERVRHQIRRKKKRERDQDGPQATEQPQESESDEARLQKQVRRYMQIQMSQQQLRLQQNQRFLDRFGHTKLPAPEEEGPEPRPEGAPVVLESFSLDPLDPVQQEQSEQRPPEPPLRPAIGPTTSLLQRLEQQANDASPTQPKYDLSYASGHIALRTVPQGFSSPSGNSTSGHPYQMYLDSRSREGLARLDDLVSTWGLPQPGDQIQSSTQELMGMNRFDDTDAVVQSFTNQPNFTPNFHNYTLTDDERAALWLEFDKEYRKSGGGAAGGDKH